MSRSQYISFFYLVGNYYFSIQTVLQEDRIRPKYTTNADEFGTIALSLAKAGYFSGNIGIIGKTKIDKVLDTYNFEIFCNQYFDTEQELNRKKD